MAKTSKNKKARSNTSCTSTNNMKYEIANEFGVNLGATSSSRANGRVGGEMTKRLVQNGKNKASTKNKKKK